MKGYAILGTLAVLAICAAVSLYAWRKATGEVAVAQARVAEVQGTVAQANQETAIVTAQRDALRTAYENQSKRVLTLESKIEHMTCSGTWEKVTRPDGTIEERCSGTSREVGDDRVNQDLGQSVVLPPLPEPPRIALPGTESPVQASGGTGGWGMAGIVSAGLPGPFAWLVGPTRDLGPVCVGVLGGAREHAVQVGGMVQVHLAR